MSHSSRVMVGILAILLWLPLGVLAQKTSKIPVLKSIAPTSTYAPGSGFTLTVTGSNFTGGSVVQWNGGTRSTTVVNSTQLQAQISSADVASAGTARVTVYTSGKFGGTSFSALTFTINSAPTTTTATPPPTTPPPPTSTTAVLAITTTSVPGGTAGASYPTTALAASGGSPAYTWSVPTSGGALPPGVALTAAGAVSGVPTTAGTYSFTAQATDTAGQVAQKAFSLAIAAAPTTAATSGYLFQEGFENGTFAAWAPTQIWPTLNPAITNSFAHSGTHSYVQYFNLCGDSTNTACLGPTQDVNRFIYTYFDSTHNNSPNGLSTVYLRAYLYLKHPEPDGTVDVMRKLYWIADEQSGGWSGILKTDGFSGVQKFTFGINGSSLCGISAQTNAFTYQGGIGFDAWHSIELGVQLNTPGLSDGVVTLWVDGTQVAQNSGYNIRGNCTTGTQFISIGRQSQRNNYNVIDEYRYWDDIVVSGSYIGP